jgi:CRP-like cAMP-binding protein
MNRKQLIDDLQQSFNSFDIPEEEFNILESMLIPEVFKKKEFLAVEGNPADKVAFVLSGLFRAYYITETGDEKTIVFRGKGNIISSYDSYIKNKDSKFSIQALEDSTVLYITVKNFETLLASDSFWQINAGKYYMNLYAAKENRERDLLSDSAEKKYKKFLIEYPELESRINQYYIASYLGITNVSLSRIRSKLSNQET